MSEPRYEDYQASMDAATKAAWDAWAASGDPAYAKAKKAGLLGAKIDPHGSGQKGSESVTALHFQSIGPAEISEDEVSEIFDAIEDAGAVIAGKSKAFEATAAAIEKIKARWEAKNGAREVDTIAQMLMICGEAEDRNIRLKARCLKANLLSEDESLSDIAKDFAMTRANTSKISQELKKRLRLQISTTTRNAAFVEQCKRRARRVHDIKAKDKARADEIIRRKKTQPKNKP